ncbi:MAG: ribosomal protein L3 N(5)-glutamine methyltransferase [Burkholderiales bacterium]|nr:ribosomal protein L3 N(5)-glutamine methyltransferase [Burkholderiales bacterium]
MTLIELIEDGARRLGDAGVAFGHGTTNAFDEAVWLTLWQLGLPLDTPLDEPADNPDSQQKMPVALDQQELVASLIDKRIATRQPAAYLTREAWLQGVPFYVDERTIVPRSLIAEVLAEGSIDIWLSDQTRTVLDLCTGNGSLAVLAALAWPDVAVTGADLSPDALAVARINVDKHGLAERITLVKSDGLAAFRADPVTSTQPGSPPGSATTPAAQQFDLILCNPPYVNADSMAALPPEFRAEPDMALSGNTAGGTDGMDFIRPLLAQAPGHMTPDAVLVLEIGNERSFFEAAFPTLEVVWLTTSAGDDQVLLVTREALLRVGTANG